MNINKKGYILYDPVDELYLDKLSGQYNEWSINEMRLFNDINEAKVHQKAMLSIYDISYDIYAIEIIINKNRIEED